MLTLKKKKNLIVRVPLVLQLEEQECGAACLAMVLAYYKKWIPLEKVRFDCGISRDGSKAENILKAGISYGLKGALTHTGAPELLGQHRFPCIVYWNNNHFLVCCGTRKDRVILNDPANGQISVSKADFMKMYSGQCIILEPDSGFTTEGKSESILKFFWRRINYNKLALFMVMLTAFFSVAASIVIPAFYNMYTEDILTGEATSLIRGFLIVFGIIVTFSLAAQIFNAVMINRVTGRMAVISNIRFFKHILRVPMEFFSQRLSGDLMERQMENDMVANTLAGVLAPTVIQLVLLIFYLAVMIRYSWILTLVGVITAVVNLLISNRLIMKTMDLSRVQMRDEAKVSSATLSGVDMIETIKASGSEAGFYERWSGLYQAARDSKGEVQRLNRFLTPLPVLVQQISSVIVLSMGAWLIIDGHMTSGIFLAFQAMLTYFTGPIKKLQDAGQSVQAMRSYMERINDVMKYPQEVSEEDEHFDVKELEEARKLSGTIELKNVTFGYSRLDEPLIRDFSLSISPGEKIAIVGGSGSGKSTIAKLICGLYEPWSGSITFDGKEKKDIPRQIFTGSLSMVSQDITIFADSIENNIKMWDETIHDYDMVLASRDAGIHDEIIHRRGGYRSVLEEDGKNISGGQRQQIEIARVLAGDPSIIILDEATSALDEKTEHRVSDAIGQRGITCIIAAHRLSTIRSCNKIIVLDHGKIAEEGTHDELMALNGLYTKLVTTE